jgi:hypothetical protein
VGNVQDFEARTLAEGVWKDAELIVRHIQEAEAGELTYLIGYGS